MQRTLDNHKYSSILTGFLYTSHNVDVCDVLQSVACGYGVVGDAQLIVICADL